MKSTPEHPEDPSRREASNFDTHLNPSEAPRKAYMPPALVSEGRLTIHAGSLNLWQKGP